ncbi:MAG: aminotransferase class III-fold pyridoxal phosphate-dependent enzyme, partial [Candidatus Latescibacterota bacterium]
GALLIFDEVQTGCGRIGTFSYAEVAGVSPSIISLAKSLGSGVPVGAVVLDDNVASSIEIGDQGSTFGGGMLAMAAVIATLETIRDQGLQKHAVRIEERVRGALAGSVKEIRGHGCLLGIDLGIPAAPVIKNLRGQGVLVGSSSDPHTIRIMPPINCDLDVVDDALELFGTALEEIPNSYKALA